MRDKGHCLFLIKSECGSQVLSHMAVSQQAKFPQVIKGRISDPSFPDPAKKEDKSGQAAGLIIATRYTSPLLLRGLTLYGAGWSVSCQQKFRASSVILSALRCGALIFRTASLRLSF